LNDLISKRNSKMWDADPINAVDFEIGYLVESSGSRGLTIKEQQRFRDLTRLKEELEENYENISLSTKTI